MPYLIKKSSGQRTCQQSANPKGSVPIDSNPLSDLISALKGLKFKIEISITDIEYKNSEEPPAHQHIPDPDSIIKPVTNLFGHKISENTTVRQKTPDPEPIVKPITNLIDSKSSGLPSARQPTPDSETIVKPVTNLIENKSPGDAPACQKTPDPEPIVKPVTNLIRGTLDPGTMIETVLLAADATKSPPEGYIPYNTQNFSTIECKLLQNAAQIERMQIPDVPKRGDIVFAKSKDDGAWYRAIIENLDIETADVFFFDWGLKEKLDLTSIRHLMLPELGLSKQPACAVRVNIRNPNHPTLNKAMSCEQLVRLTIDYYDELNQSYSVSLV